MNRPTCTNIFSRRYSLRKPPTDNNDSTDRIDHRVILEMIAPEATVLDLGCGRGELLALLAEKKNVRGQGIEIDDQAIFQCVAKGLSVFHGDIDSGLSEYGDESFDYVILNQTFQQVKKPDVVLKEALRVGRRLVVGIPNFAHLTARFQMFFGGRTPITPALPYEWHDTPNIHFLSIVDFMEYCRKRKIWIEEARFLGTERTVRFLPNLRAQTAIFVITRPQEAIA
jgi:methionine biosynthesis protein MetW